MNDDLSPEDKYRYDMINYKNQYSLEKYYDLIKDHTPRTVFLELSHTEAS